MSEQPAPEQTSHALSIDAPVDGVDRRVVFAVRLSALANLALFFAKLVAFAISGSRSILASLADSGVDLVSQAVVFFCSLRTRRVDSRYPVGKARLETVGAILVACIMTFAAVLVIQKSIGDLVNGFRSGDPVVPSMDAAVYVIVISAILLKAILFFFCQMLKSVSDATMLLAQDHLNDVLSNTVVVIAASVATTADHKYWYVDPIGGIAISAFIVVCWMMLADKQIKKIVGLSAPQHFRDRIHEMASEHDGRMEVDVVRAYHLGLRFFVEIDVVMPGMVSLFDSHDSALDLQRKIENLEEVERAFVHVDYTRRQCPEHKLDWSRS